MNISPENNPRHDLTDKDFYQQACSYFYYHAEQRTTMINFFIAVFAACIALYGSLITAYSLASTLIAVFLLIVSVLFYLIDRRNKFDVKQSQNVIEQIERCYSVDSPTEDAPCYAFGVFSNESKIFKFYSLKDRMKKDSKEYNDVRKLYNKVKKQKKKGKVTSDLSREEERLNKAIELLAQNNPSVSKKELINSLESGSVVSLSYSIKMLYCVCIAISFLAFVLALLISLKTI